MTKRANGTKLAWGLVLIGLAVIIFLSNMNVYVWDVLARLWPIILIIWGAWKLYYGLKERQEELEKAQE
jgi:putative Mn2+ efflux pump MntP